MRLGYFLSSEECSPARMLDQARRAQDAGFHALWISDHFHPWNDAQGHSPFVWSMIGAIAQAVPGMPLTTAVTCPTVRIHPAIVAQAAATSALLLDGRFSLGVGSGEALNERVLGDSWPPADVRLEMLEEAVEILRLLWQGGTQSHRGRHYLVENARIYDLPAEPPPVLVSGFGPKAIDLAARIGDGFCTVAPDAEAIGRYRTAGGGDRPVHAGVKVCWGTDAATARRTAHRLWPNDQLPGELAQILPTPAHFEQASSLVSEDMVAAGVACGPDLDRHVEALRAYEAAGVDELFVQQIGPEHEGFFAAYSQNVLPHFER